MKTKTEKILDYAMLAAALVLIALMAVGAFGG